MWATIPAGFKPRSKSPASFYSSSDHSPVTMSTFVLLLLLFGILFTETNCDTMNMTADSQMWSPRASNESVLLGLQSARSYGTLPRYVSSRMRDLRSTGNTINDTPRRRSKFLGGLAFLAGLSVGGLASAASSSVKSVAKLPPASVTLNVGPPRISPYFSGYYDPYSFIPHHYFYPNPFSLYPFLDPAKFQSQHFVGQTQNGLHPATTQNQVLPEVVNILDNKRPSDLQDNEEEYIDENAKVENERINKEKTSKRAEDGSTDQSESEEEADEREEQKMTTHTTPCAEKHRLKKPANKNTPKIQMEEESYQEEEDDSGESSNIREDALTRQTATNATANNQNTTSTTATPTTMTANLTAANANTTDYGVPFFGYYGGNPQPINNYQFTTEQYFDYNQMNYGLPSEKPANFHPYEAYPPFQSPQSFFSSGLYLPEPPDYLNNGYDRLSSVPESLPPHVSGFRPNYYRSL